MCTTQTPEPWNARAQPLGAGWQPWQGLCQHKHHSPHPFPSGTSLGERGIHYRRPAPGHPRIAMDEATVLDEFGCSSFSSDKCCRRSKLTKFLAGRHHKMIQQWLSVHD